MFFRTDLQTYEKKATKINYVAMKKKFSPFTTKNHILHQLQISKLTHFTEISGNVEIKPADKYMFKVNNRNTRTRCKISSKLALKTSGRRHWRKGEGARK